MKFFHLGLAVRQAGRLATSIAALGLAATMTLYTAPVQAQVSFLSAQNFAGGDSSYSITVGDLDGDGDLDLATANYYSDNVSVLKNNGNGTFATAQNFVAGNDPFFITIGDLDGDGDLDLATANAGSDNVSVLKNNGGGTFAAPQNFATGNSPRSVTVGDLDGDGDLDLATGNLSTYPYYSNNVSVLKNKGDGTFVAPQNLAGGGNAVTIGDLDSDGDLDLVAANLYNDDVAVFKNNGNGSFAAPQYFAGGGTSTVGDLDGDGDLDLATINYDSNAVTVLKNNGNGSFAAPQYFALGTGSNTIAVGDLDGDGDLDLVVNKSYFGVSVLRNKGNGTFTAPQNFAGGDSSYSIAVGDLDGDGDLDLATANYGSDSVSVLQSTAPTLQLSRSSDRSNPVPLAGQTVKGNVYVFASGKDSDFLQVRFYIDDPDRSGESFRTELAAPFDLSGGTVSKANPSNSRALTNGTHTITATFARTNGTFRTITSTFTVGN